ncbi:MAG: cell wall metabolism sensor histidine kinase WalK [Pelosinus sp.]|nr:cell wall metabolism sensor histidine kinase WalK [Pelosinus sp.]
MFHWNIRNRLLVSFLFLIILTMSILGSYILWYFNQYNVENLTKQLLTHAQVVDLLIAPYMRGPKEKSTIDTLIKELASIADLRITVIDANGTVLGDSWENPSIMENHLARPEINAALINKTGTSIRYSDTLSQNMLYAAMAIKQENEVLGVVRVASTLSHVETGFDEIKSALLAALSLTSLLAIFISIKLARKYTAPLEKITAIASKIAGGDLNARIHIRTQDELELLAHTINTLTSNLEDKIIEARAETEKLSLILQHMDNAVILLDRFGRVTTANKMARDIFSIKPEMLGQHTLQIIGNSQLSQAVQDTITGGESRLIDLKTSMQNGKRVFQVFLAPITIEKETTGILSVFHDITAWQEMQERQAAFVANASHELSTPLTAIKGFAETLLDGALADPELGRKFITIIQNEAERMHRLIKDLLQMAKLNSKEYQKQVVLVPTPLALVIETVVNELTPALKQKQHALTLQEDDTISVLANPDWLKQVLVNLLDNAIKYTPQNGSISITTWQTEKLAYIRVKDSGIGIAAKDLPLIFDRFYRVERARTRSTGGTGLGLAIVKFIVEMHGGTIDAASEINTGTAFTFTIPISK